MAIKQRTPLIKPRNQGGTFYTFGSALEDIGLNISETNNKVSISHYMMLDIPDFGAESENPTLSIDFKGNYTDPDTQGDYIFAEYFQDAILNMETVIRNQVEYNFASPHTVSERVFWKWLFKDVPDSSFITDDGEHYYIENPLNAYAKCFGRIVSGAQRVDSEGIYNETFVQIPSSYGQMRVLFKTVSDENYAKDSSYYSSNGNKIEGIQNSEIENNVIKETGIDARGIFDDDSSTCYTSFGKLTDMLEAVINLDELSLYYNRSNLTYDDLGFGDVDDEISGDFKFNAILVYYSIYDSTGNNVLSTNAFGVYLLGSAMKSGQFETFMFPEFDKRKSTVAQSGTSFSFRINVKPTSAYSGDITVSDNSTTAFAESTDFNDVIKNLSIATETLKTNARTLSKIVDDNSILKNFAKTALSKVDDIEKTVATIKDSSIYDTLLVDSLMMETAGTLEYPAESISDQILKNTTVTFNSSGEASVSIDIDALGGDAKQFALGMTRQIGEKSYCDMTKFLCLLLSKNNLYKETKY